MTSKAERPNTEHRTSDFMHSDSLLHELSRFWHMPVPAAMARLHLSTRIDVLGPCSFFPLEDMLTEPALAHCVQQLSLPSELMHHDPPRNERELSERLVREDPLAAAALADLGSMEIARGELQRARDFLVRASEAAPWFSDPYFLLA